TSVVTSSPRASDCLAFDQLHGRALGNESRNQILPDQAVQECEQRTEKCFQALYNRGFAVPGGALCDSLHLDHVAWADCDVTESPVLRLRQRERAREQGSGS